MIVVDIEEAKNNICELMDEVNENSGPITIVNSSGEYAVLVGEEDWNAIWEILLSNSFPCFSKSVTKSSKTPISKSVPKSEIK